MAKRRGKFKKYRKKRGVRLLYQVLSFVLIVAAVIAGCVLFFQVEEIEVSGSTKYSNEQILSVAAVNQNANLLLLPEKEISNRITDSLPYVDRVKLKRNFPTTLRLVVEECVPQATIQTDGAWWILDAKGKILERTEESIASGYIQVAGLSLLEPCVGEAAQVVQEDEGRLKELCGLLFALRENQVAENALWIDLSDSTKIEMGYLGRFTVLLPINTEYDHKIHSNEEYNRKIEALTKIVSLLDETNRGIIDLREENGYFRPR